MVGGVVAAMRDETSSMHAIFKTSVENSDPYAEAREEVSAVVSAPLA